MDFSAPAFYTTNLTPPFILSKCFLSNSHTSVNTSGATQAILRKDTVQQQGIEPPTFQKVDRHPKAVTYYSCYMPGGWKCNEQLCGYPVTLASAQTITVLCKSLEPLISLFCFEGDTFLLFLCFLSGFEQQFSVFQRWSLDIGCFFTWGFLC